MKISPVGNVLFHVDGRTDTTELIVAFRGSANSPEFGHRRRTRWRGLGKRCHVSHRVLHH